MANPDTITLAVISVDRQPEYIHQTLASLFVSDPLVHRIPRIHVTVGTSNADYLSNYLHHERLRIWPIDEATSVEIQTWTVHRRFNYNYHRALTLPAPAGGGLCICEDDVIFRDRFLERLFDTIDEMEQETGLRDYALALTAAYDFERDHSFFRGKRFCSYGYPFYGTVCMYYPTAVAKSIAEHIKRFGVVECTKPGDLLIKDLYGDRMYACPRSLAFHIGRVSTGLGGAGSSPSFARPYELMTPETWGNTRI